MKILYISFHFAPYNHIAAIRAAKLCKYLYKMGQDIRVISASDQPLPRELALEIPREKVIYSDWRNIDGLFSSMLGKRTKVSKNRSYLTSRQKKNRHMKQAVKIYKSLVHFPDGKIGWIWPAFNNVQTLFKNWKPDIIYVSGGPFSGFILGCMLRRKYGIPWVAEYRDLWTQGHQYKFGNFRRSTEKYLENWVVDSARSFVTVSEPLAGLLRNRFNKRVSVITNAFDQEDRLPFSGSKKMFQKDKLNVVYTGQIYIDRQDPSPLFKALQNNTQLKNNVLIHFYGPNLKEKIENKFDEKLLEELNSNIRFYGLVSHEEAMKAQESADLLLLLGWTDENFGGVLTGKLFEYIGAQKQILAINNYLDDASQMVIDNNVGIFCRNVREVSIKLEKLVEMNYRKKVIPLSSSAIEQFTYRAKAAQLLKVLQSTSHVV